MDHRTLDDALEAGRRLGIVAPVGDEVGQFGIDVIDEIAPEQVEIDAAGAHHRSRVLVVDQRQQQVFQGGVFVTALVGQGQSPVKRLFETARETRQGARSYLFRDCAVRPNATSSPSRIAAGACACARDP